MTLPRSLDDIRGLRAVRWIRESTDGQMDRFGPASQHEQIDRFVERHALVEVRAPFVVAHSGRHVWRHERMAEMLSAARAGEFDVLLTGYADRWQRNLRRFLELIEDALHPAGAALVMCDRRLLSSDPRDWDQMIAEAHEAERYSRRLGERVADGLARRFEVHADQWGRPPLGFRRTGGEPSLLEVDLSTIGAAVALFERYAGGMLSQAELAAEAGLAETAVKEILRNPLYNGRVRRRRRSTEMIERDAPWRSDPPVDDALWARVTEVRAINRRGGGPRGSRVDLLRRLVFCVCGRHVRADGTFGDGQHRRHHPQPCPAWGEQQRRASATWERKLAAQISGIRLDAAAERRIVAALSAPPPDPVAPRRDDQRRRRQLALDHADGRLSDSDYLAAVRTLRADVPSETVPTSERIDPDWALAKLRALGEAWQQASGDRAAQAELLHSIYARIEVRGDEINRVHLTADAYRLGLDEALPERIRCELACPRGLGRSAPHLHRITVAGVRRSRRIA